MKVFKINVTNMKYGNKFQLSQLFSSEEKALDYIQRLDKGLEGCQVEDWWVYDYEIVEEKVI